MTQQQLDYPRDVKNQVSDPRDSADIAGVNRRLREVFSVINNLPGTAEWQYVGEAVKFLGAWVPGSGTFGLEWGAPRFRRVGYDEVQIEGLIRQTPYNAAAPIMWVMPEGFIPKTNKVFDVNCNGPGAPNYASARLDLYGYSAVGVVPGSVSFVAPGFVNGSDYVSLDNIRYSLS